MTEKIAFAMTSTNNITKKQLYNQRYFKSFYWQMCMLFSIVYICFVSWNVSLSHTHQHHSISNKKQAEFKMSIWYLRKSFCAFNKMENDSSISSIQIIQIMSILGVVHMARFLKMITRCPAKFNLNTTEKKHGLVAICYCYRRNLSHTYIELLCLLQNTYIYKFTNQIVTQIDFNKWTILQKIHFCFSELLWPRGFN